MACRILVPQPGMEPMTPGVGAQSLNHWTAREVPTWPLLKGIKEITMTQWPNMLCIIKGAIASIEEFDTIFIKTNFMYVYTDLFALGVSYQWLHPKLLSYPKELSHLGIGLGVGWGCRTFIFVFKHS